MSASRVSQILFSRVSHAARKPQQFVAPAIRCYSYFEIEIERYLLNARIPAIYAGENAKFGQPEIAIGTIPGAGGTQRLPRIIGKSKAMEMVLTGNMISAEEAEKSGQTSNYEFIKVETAGEKKNVGIVTLNRPKALNALCNQLMTEVNHALDHLNSDSSIAAVVITGNEKAFAAGADIKEMKDNSFASNLRQNFIAHWNGVAKSRKPLIAAVNGYALGGGNELAMMCDIIYAGENAKFGQPEIAIGLVSKIFPTDKVVEEAVKLGEKIASHSPLVVTIAKEAVNAAYETTLQQGLLFEKRMFHSTFSLADRKEGMTAFLEKRPPKYTNE
ncbi:putative enoyl-CoA hydratase, mitochondrial [Temnothorax longispinosus]|uniref:enoyl-CoA hydratase n=1 Tax=Temnothorax longispinosus TaxID=300112 RepID=A0A4S2JN23_9HYME|nr:putative enoyl-CoA hydratase, mitochondrial [Temnothorax longispinosus]